MFDETKCKVCGAIYDGRKKRCPHCGSRSDQIENVPATEPKLWPVTSDQHTAETFGPLIPEDAPTCFGEFDRLMQRARGCLQCAFHSGCTQYTYIKFPPNPESESDPTGRQPNEPGAKLDAGKPRLALVLGGFANALAEVGKVGTFGARKYSDDGWKQVPDAEARYSDALLRHFLTESAGESHDPDSGLLHAAHTAWNALARLEKQLARMRATE